METEKTETPRVRRIATAKKVYSPPSDTPKKRKKDKKEPEVQQPEVEPEIIEPEPAEIFAVEARPDPYPNPQLVQYYYKLQHDLMATKKKLKYEQIKFDNLITSVTSFFGKDVKDFIKISGHAKVLRDTEVVAEQESNFQKFFATPKYQITDKKIVQVMEEHNIDPKSKTKTPKAKTSTGVIKLNLRDIEGEAQNDKEGMKKSKKKKASSPIEEEKDKKKKRVKKNAPAVDDDSAIMISPSDNYGENMMKKGEHDVYQYEDVTHPESETYGSMVQNNAVNEGMKYMMNNVAYPMLQSGDPIDQAKLVQEFLKQGMKDPVIMGGMGAPAQELLNYYQSTFQS